MTSSRNPSDCRRRLAEPAVFFAILLMWLLSPSAGEEIPVHIVSGVTFNDVSSVVIPYHSVAPLFYQINYKTKITQSIPKSAQIPRPHECNSLVQAEAQNCKQKLQLSEIQNYIHDMLLVDKINFDPQTKINQNQTQTRTKRSIEFIGRGLEWCCNVATMTNLHDLAENEVQVDDKLNSLLDFVKEEHTEFTIAETKLNNFSININNVLKNLHETLQNYGTDIQFNINETSNHFESKLLQYTQETWLYIYLSLYYDQLYKIEQDCQNNKIPETLLPINTLQQDLLRLDSKISKQNMTLAISVSNIYKYYSLPICKCHYENENIVLQVKIPLKQSNLYYRAFTYNPMPLKWHDKICQLTNTDMVIIKTNFSTYIVETENNDNCNVHQSNLCLIPRYTSKFSKSSECAKYLLNGTNISNLKDHCEFHCYNSPDHVIIQEKSVNSFLLTNINEDLKIMCNNKLQSKTIPKLNIGTVELKLPCDCYVLQDSTIIISTIIPCDSRDHQSPLIFHFVPLTWTNLNNLRIDPLDKIDRTEFYNITKFILNDWNISTPTFVVKHLEPVKLFNHINVKNSWTDILDDRRIMMYILLTWTSILTILLLTSCYFIHVLNIKLSLVTRDYNTPQRDY